MNEMQLSEEWVELVKELKDFFMSRVDSENSKGFVLIYKHDRDAPQTEKAILKFGPLTDHELLGLLQNEASEAIDRIQKSNTELGSVKK